MPQDWQRGCLAAVAFHVDIDREVESPVVHVEVPAIVEVGEEVEGNLEGLAIFELLGHLSQGGGSCPHGGALAWAPWRPKPLSQLDSSVFHDRSS